MGSRVVAPSKPLQPAVRGAIRLVETDGWRMMLTRGRQRQFRQPTKPGTVTISVKESLEISRGTFHSILRQAGFKGGRCDTLL